MNIGSLLMGTKNGKYAFVEKGDIDFVVFRVRVNAAVDDESFDFVVSMEDVW
jgi:hypothetical protein